MSTQAARAPVRGYRRRKAVLDLNAPPCESRDREGTSIEIRSEEVQASQQHQSILPAPIDVEAIDDDVIESSPRAFAEVTFLSFEFCLFCFCDSNSLVG